MNLLLSSVELNVAPPSCWTKMPTKRAFSVIIMLKTHKGLALECFGEVLRAPGFGEFAPLLETRLVISGPWKPGLEKN